MRKHIFFLVAVFSTVILKTFGQVTIVNYDFNSGSSYASLTPSTAANVTCSVTSTESWQTYTGVASGANAFSSNPTAGNAMAMANSSGTNTRYFQFQLGGSNLGSYAAYKLYFQAQRSGTGASTVTIAYSLNGTSFTNFGTTQTPGNGSFSECQFDLSAVSSLSLQSTVYFRVLASGASGTGTLRIDNFQVRATQQTCSTPTKLYFTTQPVSPTQSMAMNGFSVSTTCASNVIATSCNSGTVTLTFSGTGLSGTLSAPVINGVATFTNITIFQLQNNVSFTASYSGSCGSLTSATSNTFSVLPLKNDNFDGSAPTWSYTIGTPTVVGSGGATGSDVSTLKNFGSPNNNSLVKSYSVDNASGEKGTLNTITFSNVTGLNAFGQVKFSFQIGSLGSGVGAGTDNSEYMQIETSLDGGTTWYNLLRNNGSSDHLFALSASSPVTLAYNANSVYSSGNSLWNQSAFAVNLPTGTSQFRFRITASSNRTMENWAIDNILLEGTPLSIVAGPTQTLSCPGNLATVSATASPSDVNYTWSGPSTGSTPTSSTNVVTAPGVYTVTASISGSESTASATVLVVSVTPTLEIIPGPVVICPGEHAVISATATAGSTYSWSPGGTTPTSYSTAVLVQGVYTVTATNPASACTATASVSVITCPTISYPGSPFSNTITSVSVILTNAYSPPGSFSATPSGLSIDHSTGAIDPSGSALGTYTITYYGDKYGLECSTPITAVISIVRTCTFKVNAEEDLQLCPGEVYNLSAYGGDGLIYTWAPSAGLSCTTCSSPILTAGTAATQYTVYGIKDGDVVPCASHIVNVIPREDCIENTIIGCCFSNYGAAVYVASQNTYVNVYCNLLNELGQFPDGNIKKGEFQNKGNIYVKLDWIHNAKNDLYLTPQGKTNFFGASQNITGNSNTHFNKIYLTGNGIKTTWIDEYANSDMELTTNELFIQNFMFYMKNPSAIATNTVLIGSTPSVGGGFVSTDGNGYLSRIINPGSALYLYPMGARANGSIPYRYRPIEIYNSTSTDEISVNFMNILPVVNPTSDFYSSLYANNINDKAPSVSTVNQLYYHKLKQTTAPTPYSSSLAIRSYFPSGDGSFQSLAEWEKDASHPSQWWGSTPGASGSAIPSTGLTYAGFINALTNGLQTFDGQPFTLAQSGPYVGTGGFGGGGTVITITGGGSTPTTTTSTTEPDGTTSTTVTSTTGGTTTSTITVTPPGGGTPTTSTVTTTTSTTGGVTTSTTTVATGSGTTSTTTSTTSTVGGTTTTTTSTTPTGGSPTVTTSTTTTTGGTTTSTTSTTPPGGPTTTTTNTTTTTGGTTTSTTTTTDGSTTSTTSNTTTTTGGVTSSTTTTSSSSGPGTTEICETTLGGSSSITSCTLTTSTGTTTYTSSTTTSGSGGPGTGSAGTGLGNPIGTGGGSTGITSPTTPGTYVITITPADDCTLPGEIRFTVNNDGTISPSSVEYGTGGPSGYLGPLSPDVYTIDNVNSGIILQSIPKNILTDCINTITVGTSIANDYILTAGETINVFIPNTLTGVTFGPFKLFDAANTLIATTSVPSSLSPLNNTISVPSGTPVGVYHFEFTVNAEVVKGQLIIK